MPDVLIPLAIARARGCSAETVRSWDENDVIDEMMWIDIENRVARQAEDLAEKERRNRGW